MRFPLATNIQSRSASTSKDARIVNGYIDTEGKTNWVIKRPGYSSITISPALPAASGQGIYGFVGNGNLYAFVNNTVQELPTTPSNTVSFTWGSQNSIGASFVPKAIAWSGTVFCVVGETAGSAATSTAYTSPDGITWTARTLPSSQLWEGIAWNGTTFIVVAQGNTTAAATSTDGITWAAQTMPSASNWYDVTWGLSAGVFVAVGYDGGTGTPRIATSPDGVIWTLRTVPGALGTSLSVGMHIAYNGATFVWVPNITTSTTYAYSADGITWSAGTFPVAKTYGPIAADNTKFCVLDSTNVALISTDGINWTQETLPVSTTWTTITAINNIGFVIGQGAGSTNNSYSSPDGITWTLNAFPGSALTNTVFGQNGTDFIAVGYYGTTNTAYASISNAATLSPFYPSTNKGTITSGIFTFCETETVPYMFFHNQTNAYTITGAGTFAAVTDVDFPTNQTPAYTLTPGSVYLDGYVFVMTTTGRIYNSDSENPTSWNALNYLTKTAEPDNGVGIAKHLNYLVAWGEWSGEFFYDNANATGSPLARNDTAKMEIGCANGDSIKQFLSAQSVMWVGQSRETGRGVYMLEGLAPAKVSTKAIDSFLNADAMTNVRAYNIEISGHPLYILTLKDSGYTFVYDLHEKAWYEWTSDNGSGAESYFNQEFYTSLGSIGYTLHGTSGVVSKISESVYQDNGTRIDFRIVTPLLDGGNNLNKFQFSFELIGDTSTSSGTVTVRHTKDDYNTWSSYRTIDMTKSQKIIYQLGYFRRRAFDILHIANEPCRLEAMEMAIEQGDV